MNTGINLPTKDGRVAFALRSEMGEAIANVLAKDDNSSRILNFTGVQSYSFYDIAAYLTELTGKSVTYNPVSPDVFISLLKERGIPEQIAHHVLDSMIDISNGQEDVVSTDLQNKLGRKPTSLKDGLKMLFNL
jgi:NAD(P)H dehydrogenase (quinone)